MSLMKRNLLVALSAALCTLIGVSPSMAGGAPPGPGAGKVEICHWQEDNGIWKKISVGAPSVPSHLANHDDAYPGGNTTLTLTPLNYLCEASPTLPACGDCLTGPGPGCEVSACEDAVCAIDPFCCDTAWDGICLDEANTICAEGGICTAPNG